MVLPPALPELKPVDEKSADIVLLCMSFGSNAQAVEKLLNKYKNEITSLKDENGIPLIARAIQMNDGEAVSFFMENGQDVNLPLNPINNKTNQTIKEYAKSMSDYGGREPYAWRAIESYLAVQNDCPIAVMTSRDLEALQTPDYSGDTIKLYHGTKSSSGASALQFLLDNIVPTGIKEISGTPTLSTKPLGQFFSPGSVGFVYDIPKSLVAFSDDTKPNPEAIVWIDKVSGIARIQTENKALSFSEYKAAALYRPCPISREAYPSYGGEAGAYSREHETLDSRQIELLQTIKDKLSAPYLQATFTTDIESPQVLNVVAPKSFGSLSNKIGAYREKATTTLTTHPVKIEI